MAANCLSAYGVAGSRTSTRPSTRWEVGVRRMAASGLLLALARAGWVALALGGGHLPDRERALVDLLLDLLQLGLATLGRALLLGLCLAGQLLTSRGSDMKPI